MNKSFITSLGCTLMISFHLHAGDPALAKAIDLFEAGMYPAAQRYFKTQTASGEAYYYLGEIAFIEGKADSASFYYDKGLATDPPFMLCYVGKGKLMLKSNVKEAEATMQKAFTDKASKKDPAIYTAIGNAYAANKMNDKAKDFFKQASGIDRNYAGSYIAEGNMLMAEEKVNDASNKYDMAAFQDKKNKLSRLKLAEIYFHVNPDQALTTLNELMAIDPNYAPAYRLLGELYYANGQAGKVGEMEKAGEAYSKFLSFGYGTPADYSRYATILFFNKDYKGSLAEVRKALSKNPDNLIMKRLLGYNLFEIEEHESALDAMTAFMNDPKSTHIPTDFRYFARILRKNKQDSMSIDYYSKALELDQANKSDILKEMAQAYESMKKYAMAGLFYEQYIESIKDDAVATDYFTCGKAFYNAGQRIKLIAAVDSIEQIRLFQKADEKFAIVAERISTSHLGNFWRARVQTNLDPESTQGLAKPYYEQAMAILEINPSKYPNDLFECYKYLGYYYYVQENKETSLSYLSKAQAISPNDPQVNELYKYLTQPVPKPQKK